MIRWNDGIVEFKNNNLNIHLDADQIARINNSENPAGEYFWIIAQILDGLDCYFVGEAYCLGNFAMGATIYNLHSNVCYTLNFADVGKTLLKRKTLKLYARRPDEDDMEKIEAFLNDEEE